MTAQWHQPVSTHKERRANDILLSQNAYIFPTANDTVVSLEVIFPSGRILFGDVLQTEGCYIVTKHCECVNFRVNSVQPSDLKYKSSGTDVHLYIGNRTSIPRIDIVFDLLVTKRDVLPPQIKTRAINAQTRVAARKGMSRHSVDHRQLMNEYCDVVSDPFESEQFVYTLHIPRRSGPVKTPGGDAASVMAGLVFLFIGLIISVLFYLNKNKRV